MICNRPYHSRIKQCNVRHSKVPVTIERAKCQVKFIYHAHPHLPQQTIGWDVKATCHLVNSVGTSFPLMLPGFGSRLLWAIMAVDSTCLQAHQSTFQLEKRKPRVCLSMLPTVSTLALSLAELKLMTFSPEIRDLYFLEDSLVIKSNIDLIRLYWTLCFILNIQNEKKKQWG